MIDPEDKTCSDCGITKPISDFFRDARSAGGRRSDCKTCNSAKRRKNKEANIERERAVQAAYYQKNSESIKSYVNQWRKENPDKCKQYRKDYRDRNVEAERERHRLKARRQPRERKRQTESRYLKKYPERNRAKSHRRRSRVRGNGEWLVLEKEYRRLYASDCVVCGSVEKITVDHVIPIARGGRHSIGNLQPLCLRCNTSKGARLMIEFITYRDQGADRITA